MELKTLAQKPQLVKITVDDEVVVNAYGEPVEFWMYDRQDLPTYLKLGTVKDDQAEMFNILKELLLDSKGNQILDDSNVLPLEIMAPVISSAVSHLGNTAPQTSQQ